MSEAIAEAPPPAVHVEDKPKKASTRSKVKKEDGENEPEVKVKRPVGRPRKVKEDVGDGEVVKKSTKTRAVKAAASTEVGDADENETKNKANSPLAGNAVAKCFSNVITAGDLKIETERLHALYQENPEQTEKDLNICMNRILAQYKTTTQITLCSELIQQFVSLQSAEYMMKFLFRLLDNLKVKDKAVRLRSANIIRFWLRAQTQVSEDIFSRLIDVLLEVSMDKNPLVRQEVASCLEFLQDPNDKEDRVIKSLCTIAEHDPVAKVRRTCLRVLSPTERSVGIFASRTRDEADDVRQAAWKELEDRFQLDWFSTELLVDMFDQGLGDFAPSVKAASHRTIGKWFKECRQSDVTSLLEVFDVEVNEELALKVLDALVPYVARNTIANITPSACLTKEASLWLRFICERKFDEADITAIGLMEALKQVLQVIKHSAKDSMETFYGCAFIAKQLSLACSALELMHDPFGRATVIRVINEALLLDDFPAFVVDPMTKAVRNCFASPMEDTQFVLEMTTNVLSFLSELSPLDQVKADIMKAEQLIDDYTRTKNYASLPILVAEIETLKQKEQDLIKEQQEGGESVVTFSRLVRSAALVCAVLKLVPRNFKDSLLGSLLDTICVPAIQSPDIEARAYGVEALGLLALRDVSIAKSHGVLLAKTFFDNEREDMAVRIRSLQVLFDLITVFGKDLAADFTEFDILIQYLMGMLEVDLDPEIRFTAAHGLTKLLFLGRVAYPGLVQCLLIVLFHPTSEENLKLKQCLTTFFAEYRQAKVVLQAAEPLIEAIINPSADSMCEDLPFDNVIEKLCFLLRPVANDAESDDIQLDFAIMLANKIAVYCDESPILKSLVKALCNISFGEITSKNEDKLKRLRYFVELSLRYCVDGDKVAAKQLEKFAVILEKIDPNADIELADEVRRQIATNFVRRSGLGSAESIAQQGTASRSFVNDDSEPEGSDNESSSNENDE